MPITKHEIVDKVIESLMSLRKIAYEDDEVPKSDKHWAAEVSLRVMGLASAIDSGGNIEAAFRNFDHVISDMNSGRWGHRTPYEGSECFKQIKELETFLSTNNRAAIKTFFDNDDDVEKKSAAATSGLFPSNAGQPVIKKDDVPAASDQTNASKK